MDASNSNIHIDNLGTKVYKNSKGECHRLDGPAIEFTNETKFWCKEGKYHREDGPAIEYFNGDKSWYILYKELKEKEFNLWILRIKKFV